VLKGLVEEISSAPFGGFERFQSILNKEGSNQSSKEEEEG